MQVSTWVHVCLINFEFRAITTVQHVLFKGDAGS